MQTTIILIITIFVLLSAFGIMLYYTKFRKRKNHLSENKDINEYSTNLQQLEIEKLQAQIRRLELINVELKKSKTNAVNKSTIVSTQGDLQKEKLGLEHQKQILEQEKELFRNKNKKLWDQSLAIHKERDEIDQLRRKIETKHQEVVDSINYAQRIQKALVTAESYIAGQLNDFFIFWRPRNVVSGDFYWAVKRENDFLIIVADCTGHGVPGAFMSLLGITFLAEIAAYFPTISAGDLLEKMRQKVKNALRQHSDSANKDGMDMGCLIINKNEKQLNYAGANNPLWLIRKGELIEYKATRNPIGIYRKEKQFENHIINYQKNDAIFMFSDGFVDQFGGHNYSKYKKGKFKQFLLNQTAQKTTMNYMGQQVEKEFDGWRTGQEQTDDVIVLGLRL